MSQELTPGQQVRISESVEKYGGLIGEIIYVEAAAGKGAFRREFPNSDEATARDAFVVLLENPSPGLEPVILCYEDQTSRMSAG